MGKNEIRVRATQTWREKMKDIVGAAYREQYNKPGDVHYVKDMSRKKS